MWYNINWDKLGLLLMPTFLRKDVFADYVKALLSPIRAMYDDWYKMRADNLYKLAHNGQVCYLRKALNDTFDPEERRIYIGDGVRYDQPYIYREIEHQPKYLGVLYLRHSWDYSDDGFDFRVYVPADIVADKPHELRALVDYYKEGVKRYKILEIWD